ncbi:MAG: hypothetical protein ABEJ87_04815 [Candidatus Nanohalobium sp.]
MPGEVNTERRLEHVFAGSLGIAVLLTTSLDFFRIFASISLGFFVTASFFLERDEVSSARKVLFRDIERTREPNRFPVEVAVPLIMGPLVSSFLGNPRGVLAGLLLLTFSDSISSVVGKLLGYRPNPLNRSKNIEGTIAAIVVGALLLLLLMPLTEAVIISAAVMSLESLSIGYQDFELDDNIMIPVLTSILYNLI